jgi:hypothetical protein
MQMYFLILKEFLVMKMDNLHSHYAQRVGIIRSKKTPPLALANHMTLGDIPNELRDLTVVEEAMVAKCRAKC